MINVSQPLFHPPERPMKLFCILILKALYLWNYSLILSIAKCLLSRFSCVRLFATHWTVARQAAWSMGFSRQEFWSGLLFPPLVYSYQFSSVAQSCLTLCDPMNCSTPGLPVHHQLIFCHPLLLLPSIFPSIRVFSNESAPRIRWPKYWSFSFNINPSTNTQDQNH